MPAKKIPVKPSLNEVESNVKAKRTYDYITDMNGIVIPPVQQTLLFATLKETFKNLGNVTIEETDSYAIVTFYYDSKVSNFSGTTTIYKQKQQKKARKKS